MLVMSYIADLLSPALMLLAACITFYGASQFSPKADVLCSTCSAPPPPLAAYEHLRPSPSAGPSSANVVYHLYLVARLVTSTKGRRSSRRRTRGPAPS